MQCNTPALPIRQVLSTVAPSIQDARPGRGYPESIASFEPISLTAMQSTALMSRTDTKFLVHETTLESIIEGLESAYRILEHDDTRLQPYHTVYFDSPDLQLYHDHHRGKANRFKIRSRMYIRSGLSMFEVKQRTPHGKTVKRRLQTASLAMHPEQIPRGFVRQVYPASPDKLLPTLMNRYWRMTLVHREQQERVTIDVNLAFLQRSRMIPVPGIAIIEIKQGSPTRDTQLWKRLKSRSITPTSLSKYCLGLTLFRPWIRHNNFKPLHHKLTRLMQGDSYERIH